MKYIQSFSFWSIIFSFSSLFSYFLYFTMGIPSCREYGVLNMPVFIERLWFFIVYFGSIFHLLSVLFFVISLILKWFKKEEVGRTFAFITLVITFLFLFFQGLFMNAAVYDCGRLEEIWRLLV